MPDPTRASDVDIDLVERIVNETMPLPHSTATTVLRITQSTAAMSSNSPTKSQIYDGPTFDETNYHDWKDAVYESIGWHNLSRIAIPLKDGELTMYWPNGAPPRKPIAVFVKYS